MSKTYDIPILEKAAKTNAERDASERLNGFPPESTLHPSVQLKTVMSAILCGLKMHDEDCFAEAYIMLENISDIIESHKKKSSNS